MTPTPCSRTTCSAPCSARASAAGRCRRAAASARSTHASPWCWRAGRHRNRPRQGACTSTTISSSSDDPNQEGLMTTDLLRLDDLLHRVDLPLVSNDPHTWTIAGDALSDADIECAL